MHNMPTAEHKPERGVGRGRQSALTSQVNFIYIAKNSLKTHLSQWTLRFKNNN